MDKGVEVLMPIYPDYTRNFTDFPLDYFRYGNEVTTGSMFTPFLILVIAIILYMSMSRFDVKPKQQFAATSFIYGILGVLAYLAGLTTGIWLVTYVFAFALSIVFLMVGKET